MGSIERELYMSRLVPFMGNRNAKVLVGIRRSGKSTLLEMAAARLHGTANIQSYNMEFWSNREYRDPEKLYKKIKESLADDKPNCLFIDEIQDVNEWESVIRSLVAENCCDIYLTGSNSHLLSGEFSTFLSGRLNTLNVFTLTFSECLLFEKEYRNKEDIEYTFNKFLHFGGFPSVWRADYKESEAHSEITDIVNSILMRDIVYRYAIKNPETLDRIMNYICDNVGNFTSINNIYKVLNSEYAGINKDIVYSYIDHLESACLVLKVPVFNLKGKKHLTSKYKYYLSDIGIKNALLGFRPNDIAGYLENIVYLELRSRGYAVWIGDNSDKEIDFIGEKNGKKIYVQVTTELSNEDVVAREFGNLKGIDDNYPKYVVTLNDGPLNADVEGIICCKMSDFLLRDDY